MPAPLRFGTDGWREVIADGFTFENLARASQAYADHLKNQGESRVLVGYDTRFNGHLFAKHVAQILSANGLEVLVSASYLPTPAFSFAVKHTHAAGGVMITASHNPPAYQGFKLKAHYGGTATEDIYQAVSQRANHPNLKVASPQSSRIETFDIRSDYYAALSRLVDLDLIRNSPFAFAHDAMGGAAAGWLADFFAWAELGTLQQLRATADPMFYGVNPEPLPEHLAATRDFVKHHEVDAVFITDGDGDRLGAMDSTGNFINSHQLFAILVHVLASQGKQGTVVKTFTVSRIIERLAQHHQLPIKETAVGFKHIVSAMLAGDVLIGGEESGGIGLPSHLPERDGLANSLLLMEAMTRHNKTLPALFQTLEALVDWRHAYDRLDLPLTSNSLKDKVMHALETPPTRFAGRSVDSVERLDGIKLNLSGQAWLMFRASGTEPLLRIYCEAGSHAEVQEILRQAGDFVAELGRS